MKHLLLFAVVIAFAHGKEINKELLEELIEKVLEEEETEDLEKRVTFPQDCGVNKYDNDMGDYRKRHQQSDLMSRLKRILFSDDVTNDLGSRVMGGFEALRGEQPWIAYITIDLGGDSESACGGSLILRNWVVSAAHCFFGDESEGYPKLSADKIKVYLGDHNVDVDTESSQVVMKPAKIITHPQYKASGSVSIYGDNKYDIALLKLPQAVSLNEYVKVICFPKTPLPVGSDCVAAGWGIDETGESLPKLQVVELTKISNSECQQSQDLAPGMLCAAGEPGLIADTCEGDSGGPLACLRNGRFELAGATSFGVDCTTGEEAPGVYTDIYYFQNWIKSTIDKN